MAKIEPGTSALLVLDYQNYGLDPNGYWAQHAPGLLERAAAPIARTERALATARSVGLPVIHVGQAWREGHPDVNPGEPWQVAAKEAGRTVEGTWGVEFFPPVAPLREELAVYKRCISALTGTDLDRLLRIRGIMTLVLVGGATNGAVEGTARQAADMGYRVIVIEDCCFAMSDEEHGHSCKYALSWIGSVIGVDEFIASLGATA